MLSWDHGSAQYTAAEPLAVAQHLYRLKCHIIPVKKDFIPKKRDVMIILRLNTTELEMVCMKLTACGEKTTREIQKVTVLRWEYGKRCGKQNTATSAVSLKIRPLPFPSGEKQMHGVTSKEAGISALDIAEVRNQGRESEPP